MNLAEALGAYSDTFDHALEKTPNVVATCNRIGTGNLAFSSEVRNRVAEYVTETGRDPDDYIGVEKPAWTQADLIKISEIQHDVFASQIIAVEIDGKAVKDIRPLVESRRAVAELFSAANELAEAELGNAPAENG